MKVLVLNAGSSSLKLSVIDRDEAVHGATVTDWDGGVEDLRDFINRVQFDAIGHRVVHGGWRLTRPARIDARVEQDIEAAVPLAPLHQPRALSGIRATKELAPDVPAVACFDTTFHADLPGEAATYPLPRPWLDRWRIRRFGFHGLSHAYASRRTAELLDADSSRLRVVVCHLGSGASLCAVDGGRSVDTTMGFTPLEGLVMGSRAGSVDPGLLVWLQAEAGLSLDELHTGLEQESGLRGMTGSADMEHVLRLRADGNQAARLAVDVYVHRLVASVAAMTAAMGGLDALCFTGGVGEHAAVLRTEAARRLAWLGIRLDDAANNVADRDGVISPADTAVACAVVTSREDIEVARQARQILRCLN